jgi:1,4-dihydroxy-2-naphthoate octaprenyltransferase
VAARVFPLACLAALLAAPLLVVSGRQAIDTFETPRRFIPAMRNMVACYVVAVALFTLAIAFGGWRAFS